MRRRSFSFRSVCVSLLVLGACQDLPTAVVSAPRSPAAAASTTAGEHLGQVPFYCIQGRRVPTAAGGWQARLDTLFFPRAELDERGRKVRFQYRRSTTDGKLLAAADCEVHYTEAALRRVDRFFGIQKDGAAEQFRARQEMITIQGCVTDGTCLLDPLVIVAPPPEIPPCDACNQYPGGGGYGEGGGGDWGGGGGGGYGDAYSEGPGVFAACVVAMLTTAATTAFLQPLATDLYNKAGGVDSAERMLRMVRENGASLETIGRYEDNLASARQAYNDAVLNMALGAGATSLAVMGAVLVCSPTLILPTP